MVRTRGSGITIRTSTRTRRGRVQPARGKAQSVRGRGRLPKAPDVQEDAISDASSNHYENVSDDLAILDGSPNQKKRAQPDDGPATMNDLLDQQLVFQKKSEELQRAQDLNAERIRVLASITESQPSTSQTANQRHSLSNVYGGVKGKSSLQQVTSPLVVFPATNPTSVIMDAVELPTLTSDLAARCKEAVHYRRSSSDNPREEIKNIVEWIRAFIVFAAYRQSENPQFCLPFLSYVDLITSMAERDEPWLVYDENFRRYAISKPLDTAIWCRVHERSYQNAKPRLPVSARLGLPSTTVGFGLAYAPSFGIIALHFRRRQTFATSAVTVGGGLSVMAVPPLQQLLITNYGWRESCIFIGFLTILIGLCALLLPSHQLQAAGTNEKVTFAKSANLSLFRDIPFYILMLHPFLMSGLMIYGFLPFRFVTDILEINEQGATSIIGVGGFTDMVARLLTVAVSATPWVSGRITRFNIAHVMTLLSVVCLFLFTWSTTLVALAAWSGALSFFLAIKWCMWPGLQMEMFGSNRFCTSFSYGSFVQGIGSLIFPPLGSMVAR